MGDGDGLGVLVSVAVAAPGVGVGGASVGVAVGAAGVAAAGVGVAVGAATESPSSSPPRPNRARTPRIATTVTTVYASRLTGAAPPRALLPCQLEEGTHDGVLADLVGGRRERAGGNIGAIEPREPQHEVLVPVDEPVRRLAAVEERAYAEVRADGPVSLEGVVVRVDPQHPHGVLLVRRPVRRGEDDRPRRGAGAHGLELVGQFEAGRRQPGFEVVERERVAIDAPCNAGRRGVGRGGGRGRAAAAGPGGPVGEGVAVGLVVAGAVAVAVGAGSSSSEPTPRHPTSTAAASAKAMVAASRLTATAPRGSPRTPAPAACAAARSVAARCGGAPGGEARSPSASSTESGRPVSPSRDSRCMSTTTRPRSARTSRSRTVARMS